MSSPFDDPDFRAQLAEMGIVHKPGMAAEMLSEMAPLLAAEGIDLDDLDATDLDAVNAALARATERHNLELFTPVGERRAMSLTVLRLFSEAIADGDDDLARALLAGIAPEPDGDTPAISHVIGVSLGVLDDWHTRAGRSAPVAARIPRWHDRRSRSAATDILSLAGKGRAFSALDSLHRRHSGLAIFEGGALAVAATLIAWAADENVTVADLASRELASGALPPVVERSDSPSTGASFGLPGTARPMATPVARHAASASRNAPASKKRTKRSGHPARRGMPPADRAALREFAAWLGQQAAIDAESVDDETGMLESLLTLALRIGIDPHDPADLDVLVDLLFEQEDAALAADEGAEAAEVSRGALETLHDYVHFRIDTSDDPEEWEETHEILEGALADPFPASEAIAHAIDTALGVDVEHRRAALAQTRVISAVRELLAWVGAGQSVSPSGGVRRTDIQHVAAMLGVSAVGVSKRPAFEPGVEPLADFGAPLAAPETIHALSMYDVLPLAAWWEALQTTDVIERRATRVRPGSAANDWLAERMPPHDIAEMVAGVFVAEILTHDLMRGHGIYEEDVVIEAIRRVMQALAPEIADEMDDGGATSIFTPRALVKLRYLHDAGLLATGDSGEPFVPVELRGAVARGMVLTVALLGVDDE